MTGLTCRRLGVTVSILVAILYCNTVLASNRTPERRGKVIIIRGAFTVFSLGMNELGDKLAEQGLDVEVVADIAAGRATSEIISEYRRNRKVGPIVLIGHSRGAELGPRQARELQRYRIPVKLIVMVDAVHKTTVPANVERCVNLYHNTTLGVIHGVPARAESRKTVMINTDIDKLESRSQGGSINHFNIDSSPWIHELVIDEVLKACPPVGSSGEDAVAARSTSRQGSSNAATSRSTRTPESAAQSPSTSSRSTPQSTAQRPVRTVAPKRSKSGLWYPAGVTGGLWAGSTVDRSISESSPESASGAAGSNAADSNTQPAPRSSRVDTGQRPSTGGSAKTSKQPANTETPRTAARPDDAKLKRPPAAGQLRLGPGTATRASEADKTKPSAGSKAKQKDTKPIQVKVKG